MGCHYSKLKAESKENSERWLFIIMMGGQDVCGDVPKIKLLFEDH
jgi:hypothetical protein